MNMLLRWKGFFFFLVSYWDDMNVETKPTSLGCFS